MLKVEFGPLKASAMFSIYTNLLVPGNTIKLHLDVPQFVGLDRYFRLLFTP